MMGSYLAVSRNPDLALHGRHQLWIEVRATVFQRKLGGLPLVYYGDDLFRLNLDQDVLLGLGAGLFEDRCRNRLIIGKHQALPIAKQRHNVIHRGIDKVSVFVEQCLDPLEQRISVWNDHHPLPFL